MTFAKVSTCFCTKKANPDKDHVFLCNVQLPGALNNGWTACPLLGFELPGMKNLTMLFLEKTVYCLMNEYNNFRQDYKQKIYSRQWEADQRPLFCDTQAAT